MGGERGHSIDNPDGGNEGQDETLALDCLDAGIRAANPAIGIRESVETDGTFLVVRGEEFDTTEYDRLLVVSAGRELDEK